MNSNFRFYNILLSYMFKYKEKNQKESDYFLEIYLNKT